MICSREVLAWEAAAGGGLAVFMNRYLRCASAKSMNQVLMLCPYYHTVGKDLGAYWKHDAVLRIASDSQRIQWHLRGWWPLTE